MGLANVLGVVFIVLKLMDIVDWSWWWVLSPFAIQAAIVVTVILAKELKK